MVINYLYFLVEFSNMNSIKDVSDYHKLPCLSIKPPWIFLTCQGTKTVANRRQKLNDKYIGHKMILVSNLQSMKQNEIDAVLSDMGMTLDDCKQDYMKYVTAMTYPLNKVSERLFGMALCVVRITDCVLTSDRKYSQNEPDIYKILFDEIELIQPIPIKGQLGIYHREEELKDKIQILKLENIT